MPINYRAQYLEDIGFQGKVIPYQNHDEAIKRIKSIYRTTGIYQVGNEKASMIWNDHFLEIWKNRNSLPEQLENFNQWHNKQVKNLIQIQILPLDRGRWRLGIAQKVINLFLKDLWAWKEIKDDVRHFLHTPIDRRILSKISRQNIPQGWDSWTKVFCDENTYETEYRKYMELQNFIREYYDDIGWFDCVIELEQFFWHQI